MSSYEELFWKLFFRKVQMILNILIFYHFFISLIVFELSAIKASNVRCIFAFKMLQKVTLRVSGIDGRWCLFKNILNYVHTMRGRWDICILVSHLTLIYDQHGSKKMRKNIFKNEKIRQKVTYLRRKSNVFLWRIYRF